MDKNKEMIFLITKQEKNDSLSSTSSNYESTQLYSFNPFKSFQNKSFNCIRNKKINHNFLTLKRSLQFNNKLRKTQFDSLLKKCKSKFFKSVNECLRNYTNFKFPRIPQDIITNIKIEENKIIINKTLYDIYKKFNIDIEKEYSDLPENKQKNIKIFINLKISELYNYYIESKHYLKDYFHILKKKKKNFSILFNFAAHNFISYYLESKGNRTKRIFKTTKRRRNFNSFIEKKFKNRIFNISKIKRREKIFINN